MWYCIAYFKESSIFITTAPVTFPISPSDQTTLLLNIHNHHLSIELKLMNCLSLYHQHYRLPSKWPQPCLTSLHLCPLNRFPELFNHIFSTGDTFHYLFFSLSPRLCTSGSKILHQSVWPTTMVIHNCRLNEVSESFWAPFLYLSNDNTSYKGLQERHMKSQILQVHRN